MGCGPTVSILTATYNSLEGLKETVESVAGQSTDEYEHIVIDGGSRDGTVEWLENQADGLIWISEPDQGIGDAINKGLGLASGEWILVLHAEDTFAGPNSLAKALGHLGSESDLVCFDVSFIASMGTRRLQSHGLSLRLNWKPFPHQGAFTRAALFDRVGIFDTSYAICMDYEFFLRAYRYGARSAVKHEILTRMSGTGVSSRRDWPSLRQRFSEERAIHLQHCPSLALRIVYTVYWPIYLAYRRAREFFRLDERHTW